jgi:hypothetical protein
MEEEAAMSFNFFGWIREGVKQSVLLGVSDAVETLGSPREDDDVQQRLLTFLQHDPQQAPAPKLGGPRKKLGRTLDQIQASTGKPPS